MTLLYLDGFELERTNTSFVRRYPGSTGIPTTFIDYAGRLGGKALRAETSQVIHLELPSTSSGNLFVGFGLRIGSLDDATEYNLITIYGLSDIIVARLLLQKNAEDTGYRLTLERNSSSGYLEEWSIQHELDFNYWYFLEVKFPLRTGIRGCWVKLNHDTEIIQDDEDVTVVPGYERAEIALTPKSGSFIAIDDLYVSDFDFLDPTYWIQGISPASDYSVEWTPNTGTNHNAIDDAEDNQSVDDDTTYVEGTSGETDLYQYTKIKNAHSKSPAIRNAFDSKSTSGDDTFTPIFKEEDQSSLDALGSGYTQVSEIYEDPGTILELIDMKSGFRAD